MPNRHLETNLPSIKKLRAATSPAGVPPFRVGTVIGPGFIPMDMVGIQTVFGLMPGAEIHLLWKSTELVEGFPNWWTQPTTTFADWSRGSDRSLLDSTVVSGTAWAAAHFETRTREPAPVVFSFSRQTSGVRYHRAYGEALGNTASL